jgi:hypothetical protein
MSDYYFLTIRNDPFKEIMTEVCFHSMAKIRTQHCVLASANFDMVTHTYIHANMKLP